MNTGSSSPNSGIETWTALITVPAYHRVQILLRGDSMEFKDDVHKYHTTINPDSKVLYYLAVHRNFIVFIEMCLFT